MKTFASQQKSLTPVANRKPQTAFGPNRSSLLSPNARTLADMHRPLVQTKLTVNEPGDLYEQEADRMAEETTRSNAAPSQVSIPRYGHDFSKIRIFPSAQQIQTKLTVNEPGDKYEQEADRIAEEVMRAPDFYGGAISAGGPPNVQKKCAACESGGGLCPECAEEEEKKLQRKPLTWRLPSLVQREQAMPGSGQNSLLTADLNTRVQALASTGGMPLPESERKFFEPRLGFDFSPVRVFNDANAAELAHDLSARAFTLGHNIVFGRREYAPETDTGRRLMAHELTHVVQQGGLKSDQGTVQRISVNEKEEQQDPCAGMETDPESFAIILARHFFRTELGQDIRVEIADCDPPSSSRLVICDLTLSDGTRVRVFYNPQRNLARVQVRTASGTLQYCRYSYTCADDGAVNLVKLDCGGFGQSP